MTTTTARVRHVEPGEGPVTWAMNSLFERLTSGDDTGGAFDVSVVTQPAGIATPLHVHTREAEAFYVLEGTMTYRAGDDTYQLRAGSFIYLPADVPHAFRVTGSGVRFLGLTAPSGLMALYDEVGVPAADRELPDGRGLAFADEVSRWNELGPRYGLRVVGPPLEA
jgi:quercetin dioxygenase-like cupin family protein